MDARVVALMYHGVGEPADVAEGKRYTVRVEDLEAQLEVVEGLGGVLDPRRVGLGEGGIVLTFDDGERTVLTEVLPRLARRGWVAALFVTTAWIGRPGYLSAAELVAIRRAGWTVGSHGDTHRILSTLPEPELRAELSRSAERLAEVVGEWPTHLAFPGGRTSPLVEHTARAVGFTTLWSSSPGVNSALLPGAPFRRTAIRRGLELARFRRLARGETVAHVTDQLDVALRDAVKRAIGDELYHAMTGSILAALGRR
jgi:peptidoglycan/xylan/chitin deacetylase (PgdA/CDA1 family)